MFNAHLFCFFIFVGSHLQLIMNKIFDFFTGMNLLRSISRNRETATDDTTIAYTKMDSSMLSLTSLVGDREEIGEFPKLPPEVLQ